MGGFFGVASKNDCVFDLFFGIDYHSHLGTKKGGMAVHGENGFDRAIHNISNSPFRTKFEQDVLEMKGNLGIGCISDTEPQPLIVRSHLGNYSITTVGRINNTDELVEQLFKDGTPHFLEMSGGDINPTELVASLINMKDTLVEGIRYAQEKIDGSMSMLIMTPDAIYAARDLLGRTPVAIGVKKDAFCAAFESSSYINLGYVDYKELGPAEIVKFKYDKCETVSEPRKKMKMCTFMWVYYGYPSSCYEGLNVEELRYRCGRFMAKRDDVVADTVAGIPDSGTPCAIGYSQESGISFTRPFIKYTPTWPRSFMSQYQHQREVVAKMKLIPLQALIENKRLMLVDDSIVRGTQMKDTAEFLYEHGAKEVHVRSSCPPIMFGCKYLNFSRSTSDMDLIARRVLASKGITDVKEMEPYLDPETAEYNRMVNDISAKLSFTSLRYNRLDDMLAAVGIDECDLCTYCWNGKE
ncbi:MAG: amidophosphoribosyltransferase [Clostridia bacterium]|nr:amidophosphoribosyltransferase [Clostridia bacterium]